MVCACTYTRTSTCTHTRTHTHTHTHAHTRSRGCTLALRHCAGNICRKFSKLGFYSKLENLRNAMLPYASKHARVFAGIEALRKPYRKYESFHHRERLLLVQKCTSKNPWWIYNIYSIFNIFIVYTLYLCILIYIIYHQMRFLNHIHTYVNT